MQKSETKLDVWAADLLARNAGRPWASLREVAALTGYATITVRRAVHAGNLTASRNAPNGPMRFHVREIARWMVAGEQNSLPVNVGLDRRAAMADDDDADEAPSRTARKGGRK